MARVIILGGGFGGIAAATALRDLDTGDEIIVIARDDRFAMGFAKLWDLAGMRPLSGGTRSLTDLDGITYVPADVTSIHAEDRRVETSAGAFDADGLVVALGARPAPAHRELLSGPGAFDLYDVTALPDIRAALHKVDAGRVVVSILGAPYKCPPAPYEAALVIDGVLRERGVRSDVEVVLTTPQPITLPVAGVDASRYVAEHLDDHGVELRAEHKVAAADGERRVLAFADRDALPYEVLLGVPADAPPEALVGSGLTNAAGWIAPDRHTLAAAPLVYAVGDCTQIPTAKGQLPHAGVFAAAQGRVAAHNLAVDLHGGEHARFDGHGYCFMELPGQQVAFIEGDFYADPPDVALVPADHAQFERKQAYERDHLAAWFG